MKIDALSREFLASRHIVWKGKSVLWPCQSVEALSPSLCIIISVLRACRKEFPTKVQSRNTKSANVQSDRRKPPQLLFSHFSDSQNLHFICFVGSTACTLYRSRKRIPGTFADQMFENASIEHDAETERKEVEGLEQRTSGKDGAFYYFPKRNMQMSRNT